MDMSEKNNEDIMPLAKQDSVSNESSVNYDNLGEVFTKVEAWIDSDDPDLVGVSVESSIWSTEDGVSGWGISATRGFDFNGETFLDEADAPEVINYTDIICNNQSSWFINKQHEAKKARFFVLSIGQLVTEPPAEFPPNVAPYPTNNEVSVELTIPAKTNYTVTYNANNGTNAPAAQTKWHNETLVLSSQVPTRTDYEFQGWATSADSTAIAYAPGASYTENANVTLYAIWKPRPNIISYNANGGTNAPDDQTKPYGESITLSTQKPIRQGYTFQGWATSASATSAQYQPGATYTENKDLALYAVWAIITYEIHYDANGGTGAPSSQLKNYGETVSLATSAPTKEGHTFQGWSKAANSTDIAYRPGDKYSDNANITLYAVWKIITYTISYNANNGTGAPQDQTKEWNKTITLSSTKPTRVGYTFQGWATSASSTSVAYQPGASYTANADVTLYAIWKIIVYTVTYNANGGYNAPANQTHEYGKSVKITTDKPRRVNHNFLGWSSTADGEVEYVGGDNYSTNADITLYAVWKYVPIMSTLNGYEIYDAAVRELSNGIKTEGTGAAYVAEVDAIDTLTNGVSFILIPHVANTSTAPTLNINNFGAKQIRQRLSNGTDKSVALTNGFLAANKPVHVVYDGTYWIVDMAKAVASALEGIVPISKGGLGVDLNTQVGKVPYTTSNYVKFADWTKGALYPNGQDLISGILPVKFGGTGATTAAKALNNLGITWGTAAPPAKGTPNSIYIQIN